MTQFDYVWLAYGVALIIWLWCVASTFCLQRKAKHDGSAT